MSAVYQNLPEAAKAFRHEVIGDCILFNADCLAVLPTLGRVDAVVTDPPYSSGGFQESGKSGGSIVGRTKERLKNEGKEAAIHLDNLSTRGYLRLMSRVLRQSKADEFFVFTDWKMWIATFDAFEDGGVRVRNMLVWDKNQMGMGMPWRNQHELIAYGKRRPGSIVTGKNGNVIRCGRSGNQNHPTEKPVELIETLLGNSLAQTVLDPFMGSGTTGVACVKEGRSFIGIEIDEGYFEIACERIRKAYAQPDFFVEASKTQQPKQESLFGGEAA